MAGRRVRRPSIGDVARHAGVSLGTVSNVLNRPDRVSPATRARVEQSIEELSFVPSGPARQLRAGSISTVGAIVLDIANPFFTEVARGIEDRLAEDDYTLMLASSDEDPARESRYLRLFEEHGVRGITVTPATSELSHLDALSARGVDVVLLDWRVSALHPAPFPSVAVDDVIGAGMAVQHLLDRGHRRIAFLNGPLSIRQCADRRAGAMLAMEAAGLDPTTALVEVMVSALNADGGAAGVRHLLEDDGARPSALFCVNDLTALGALRELHEQGIAVPQDMAVVGYDDVSFAAMLSTPLTSVRQPTHLVGYTAAALLLDQHGTGEPQHVQFRPELVVRASSG